MKNIIRIEDWTGKELFEGNYKSKEVDKVLDANRCSCEDECDDCGGTGYSSDFEVYWLDEKDERNVYEYINY